MNDDADLWQAVGRMRAQPNHAPRIASRDELIDHIARLTAEMEERIQVAVAKSLREEREKLRARMVALEKRNRHLSAQVTRLRAERAGA